MKRKTKYILLLAAFVIVANIAAITGTLAYLKDSTGTLTNTFTVGKVKITMDESKVDIMGHQVTGAARVTANDYILVPGQKYTKDPYITVEAGSEPCYVFVKLDNQLSNIIFSDSNTKSVEDQITANGWQSLSGYPGVYYKDNIAAGSGSAVFGDFTVKDDADVSQYDKKQILVKAYAIQKEGLADADTAWKALGTP